MAKKNTKKAQKATKKETTKKAAVKKDPKKGDGKTALVLKMAEAGKTRKQIIDKLVEMNPDVSRKSNAGLVVHIFKRYDLIGKVDSGVERKAKKKIKVKAKK